MTEIALSAILLGVCWGMPIGGLSFAHSHCTFNKLGDSQMKKYLFCLIAGLISTSVLAAELQMPPSALSNVPPNDQKVVAVAQFDPSHSSVGQNPKEMTVRELVSNRSTIGSADEKMLCVVESVSNPERKSGGICVSAKTTPATLKIATFKNATGTPINPREELHSEFYGEKNASIALASDGTLHFECVRDDNGRNTGTCKPEDND